MRLMMTRSILSAAGLLVALLLGEMLVRAVGAAPEVAFFHREQFQLSRNPRIGWEPIPNPGSVGKDRLGRWQPEERNSLGYRDYEHSPEKAPGVYRILVLGDSITKGLGIRDKDKVFTAVLERHLNGAGLRSEVLNFGVEGYNTQQEVETLRDKGLRFDPDLVILAYGLNDRDWPAHHLYKELLQEEQASDRISGARVSPYLARSALYRFLRYRVFPGGGAAGEPDERIREAIALVEGDTVEEYFGVLSDLARDNGFEVLVAVFPYLEDLGDYAHFDQHEWVQRLSARHGFHHLDLLPMFVECAGHYKHVIAFDEVHPNSLGHNCAGLAITEFIKNRIGGVVGTP